MSTHWDVFCLDCKMRHGFDETNHWEEEMLFLCKHADTIAGLVELVTDFKGYNKPKIGFPSGSQFFKEIDPEWFRNHLGHNLQPIDENGGFLEQCPLYAKCVSCDYDHPCSLDHGHTEPCNPKRRDA